MNDVQTIPRAIQLPTVSDYNKLREEFMRYILALGSKIWTDHNVHDPGITIAEVLCYAITECGYKLGFSMADLLAGKPSGKRKDFFTARELLGNNPTTILDLRKFVIDIPGIQNAWFYKYYYPFDSGIAPACANEYYTNPGDGELQVCKPAFYYQCQGSTKAYDVRFNNPGGYIPKYINGLYNVVLQLEESEEFGDLNANVIPWVIEDNNKAFKIKIVVPVVGVSFPAWDYPMERILGYGNLTKIEIGEVGGDGSRRKIDKITFYFGPDPAKKIEIIDIPVIIETRGTLDNDTIEIQLKAKALSLGILYTRRLKTILGLINKVHCALHGVRNLCVDYVKYSIVRQQEILLCAEIEIEPTADLEMILAEIYFRVDNFLAPPVRFYGLDEMYDKGKRTEEIFNGCILNHGFIDDDELKLSDLKTEVHTSDLYQIIMDIPGVRAIKHLQITNYLDGVPMTTGELWCLKLNGAFSLNLSRESTKKIYFYRNGLNVSARHDQAELIIKRLRAESSKPKLLNAQNDWPVPVGSYRNLTDYSSVQNDFPEIYKTGRNGISATDSSERIAHVKQLKAFLLFFDQLLVNFFGQLDLARDLLSMDKSVNIPVTYARMLVYDQSAGSELPNFSHVQNLIKDFTDTLPASTDLDDESSYKAQWEQFAKDDNNAFITHLKDLIEDKETYYERRHLFLDHLIARFAENLEEYSRIYNEMSPPLPDLLLEDKRSFLDDYPRLSSERGKAFRYKCCGAANNSGWPGQNISGLQRRVSRLLGINDPTDRLLLPVERDFQKVIVAGSTRNFQFRKLGVDPVLLESKPPHFEDNAYCDVVFSVIAHAPDRDNYHATAGHSFELRDKQGNVLAIPVGGFPTDLDRDKFIEELIAYFDKEYFQEGFHLIEHVLLRPVQEGMVTAADVDEGYFGLCKLDEDCDCPITDHYSFRITIAIPFWPRRFSNMSFRAYAERLIRYETPAHILAKICWIDFKDMLELEKRYLEWVTLECQYMPDRTALNLAITKLIKVINNMKNIYPDGVLHDCDNPTDDDAIVLNQSALGTLDDEANS